LHLGGHFSNICVMMHGSMNVKHLKFHSNVLAKRAFLLLNFNFVIENMALISLVYTAPLFFGLFR